MNLKGILKKNKLLFPIYKILSYVKNYNLIKLERYYEKVFSNAVEGNIVVKLTNISGEYEIDVRSHILKRILLTKEYEPRIVDLILKNVNKNKDAINIGANVGLFSNLIANKININRKILAIEPTPNAFKMLENNISRNKNEDKVIAFNGIASDKEGEYQINIVQGMEEYSSIGRLVHSAVENNKFIKLEVKGDTIDNLVKKYKIEPSLIVIDVEGAEFNVLKGARETLKKFHPIIISELNDKLLAQQDSNSKQIINFLLELNYKIVDSESNNLDFPFEGNIIAKSIE